MDIVIAGAGTVGQSLAHTLSFKHNVIVIDQNISKLNRLDIEIDLLTICGNIEDPKTYQSLDMNRADLFIAVTDSDEANILSTLIVEDVVRVDKKIIRLKNDDFIYSKVLDKLSIDFVVFPDLTTADKVRALLSYPQANNIKVFEQTNYQLISIRVDLDGDISFRVDDFINTNVSIVGIERQKSFFIPKVDSEILQDDLIYFFGKFEKIKEIASKLDTKISTSIKKVAIFGANALARKIAKALLGNGLDIKIIDKNIEFCELASVELEGRATVINSSYGEHKVFETENLSEADMVITAGYDDEQNIVKSIEAKEYGISKVVAVNNDKDYYSLMHKLGIIVVRGSKAGAYYAILENIASSSIISQRHFCGGSAVLFMRKIYPSSKLIGKKIDELKNDHLKLLFVRDGQICDFSEIDLLKEGDVIVIFGDIKAKEEIEQWIYKI